MSDNGSTMRDEGVLEMMKFTGDTEWREVVGVFRDVRHWGLDQPLNPEMYLPLPQWPSSGMMFVLAGDLEPGALASAVREALKDVDPNLAMSDVRTMDDVAARSVASQRALMLLLGSFAGLALVLAAAGIYGVMAHLVTLRTAEIGVRLTLGAAPADVMRLVFREGLLQAAAGLTLGLTAALVLARFFRALLYGISPADPFTLTAVVLLLLATAFVACLVPARRAMKVDPVAALR